MSQPAGSVRDRVLTVPNALSVLRLLLVPVFLYLLLVSHHRGWAVGVLMFSGFSDWADGKIARLVDNQSSRLGELLDPAVDRIYMVTVRCRGGSCWHCSGVTSSSPRRCRCCGAGG
jgi:cardiolipin synthase